MPPLMKHHISGTIKKKSMCIDIALLVVVRLQKKNKYRRSSWNTTRGVERNKGNDWRCKIDKKVVPPSGWWGEAGEITIGGVVGFINS